MTSRPQGAPSSVAVLGLLANSEFSAFSRMAADAELAPSLGQRLVLCRFGAVAVTRLGRIEARVTELGGDLVHAAGPFLGTFADFDRRTPTDDWWERLLKAYVGYGVEDDFARLLAEALDPATRELVGDLLADDAHARFVVQTLRKATAEDGALAARLALWGRRLVGEALGVVQRVVDEHAELGGLLEVVLAPDPGDLQQRLFAVLTGEHTRRMARLGLTA